MNSFRANLSVDHSDEALIDWNTPEILKNKTFEEDCVNNPFDKIALKAENMDPFELVSLQTSTRENPPCDNILSPLFKLEFRQKKKRMSFTDIDDDTNFLDQTYPVQMKIDGVKNKLNNNDVLVCVNEKIVDQSRENDTLVQIDKTKIENQDPVVSILDQNNIDLNVDIEHIQLCTEEEKKLIREETRQRIEILIEKGKKNFEENSLQKSFCRLPSFSDSSHTHESLFNRGFIRNNSNNDFNSKICDNSSFNNVSNDYEPSNLLELMEPEWVVDSFIDNDKLMEDQIDTSVSIVEPINNQVDVMSKANNLIDHEQFNNINKVDVAWKTSNRIEIVESIPIGCQAVIMKSTQNKRTLNKGPFLANIPIRHMVQNYNADIKEKSRAHILRNHMEPVAHSTPTSNIATTFKTPSSNSSIRSKSFISSKFMSDSAERSNSQLNLTKCVKRSVSNVESALLNLDLNTSKWENKMRTIQKPTTLKTNRSALPVFKQSKSSFKGKENVTLQWCSNTN